jgi:hypothetical protein
LCAALISAPDGKLVAPTEASSIRNAASVKAVFDFM